MKHLPGKTALLCTVLGFWLSIGCKSLPKSESGSDVKYGYLPALRQSQLVFLPDGGTVRLCGARYEDITWAISVWAKELGRTFQFVTDCTNADINVYGASDAFAISECKRYGLVGREYTQYSVTPMQVVDCGGMTRPLALHEAGHLFGLCDQYPEQISACDVTTIAVPGSVMHSASTLELTPDDVEGIVTLAAKYSQTAKVAKYLVSGTYDGFNGSKISYKITPETSNGRTTLLSLEFEKQTWPYPCDESGLCRDSNSSIKILGPKQFDYKGPDGSVMRMNHNPTLDLADAGDASPATGPSPAPRFETTTFDAGTGRFFACKEGRAACAQLGDDALGACYCSYYTHCFGVEVAEHCTKPR